MREPMEERICTALDECLSGVEHLPTLESRVLQRVKGERRGPVRLTAAMAVALLLALLCATAVAVGTLAGWFRLEQKEIGALDECVGMDDDLYLISRNSLCRWAPGMEKAEEVLPLDSSFSDVLLCRDGDSVGLLELRTRKLWWYGTDGELRKGASFDNAAEIDWGRVKEAVYQDGWLFLRVIAPSDVLHDGRLYRLNPATGSAQRLELGTVADICAYEPGNLLVQVTVGTADEERLLALDTELGTVRQTLFTTHQQGLAGLAYNRAQGGLYAQVGGVLSHWEGTDWKSLQGYASNFLTNACAVVKGGYVTVSHGGMSYVPFVQSQTLPTLTIRGYMASTNVDDEFQTLHPGVAVTREKMPSLKAWEVRQAIEAGDTTDLFHVSMDAHLAGLIADGLAAPLNASEALMRDVRETAQVFAQPLWREENLCAVPSVVNVSVWEAEDAPQTYAQLLARQAAHTGDTPLIAHGWDDGEWGKKDYASAILRAFIKESGEEIDFENEAFQSTLRALHDVSLPSVTGQAEIQTDQTVNLIGERLGENEGEIDFSSPRPEAPLPRWSPEASVSEGAARGCDAWLVVYVLNPNARNPELAMAFLEYMAAHRWCTTEAELKPDTAQPTLHEGAENMMDWIREDQLALEKEMGLPHDEEALKQRLEAVRQDPSSWGVIASKLELYREAVVPYLRLSLNPLLAAPSTRKDGAFSLMVEAVTDYAEGRGTLEECVDTLDRLARQELTPP